MVLTTDQKWSLDCFSLQPSFLPLWSSLLETGDLTYSLCCSYRTRSMLKRQAEINSDLKTDMCVRATGKMSRSAPVAKQEEYVGRRLLYYCMTMGKNNLISFHSRALFEVKQLPDSSLQ